MRRAPTLCLMALAASLLVSGCALKDPRDSYAYGRLSDGLWDADYDLLLDWNFPTSANQGPIEAPKRFRPEPASIGVPWARRAPWQLPPPNDKGADAGKAAGSHDAVALGARPSGERPDARVVAASPGAAAPAAAGRAADGSALAGPDRVARADVRPLR